MGLRSKIARVIRRIFRAFWEGVIDMVQVYMDFCYWKAYVTTVDHSIDVVTAWPMPVLEPTSLVHIKWEKTISIIFFINRSPINRVITYRWLRMWLRHFIPWFGWEVNYMRVMYLLTLIETTVKYTNLKFRRLVTQRSFIHLMLKFAHPKVVAPPRLRLKVYSIIQTWAVALGELKGFCEVAALYREMKEDGVIFPAVDHEAVDELCIRLNDSLPERMNQGAIYDIPQQ